MYMYVCMFVYVLAYHMSYTVYDMYVCMCVQLWQLRFHSTCFSRVELNAFSCVLVLLLAGSCNCSGFSSSRFTFWACSGCCPGSFTHRHCSRTTVAFCDTSISMFSSRHTVPSLSARVLHHTFSNTSPNLTTIAVAANKVSGCELVQVSRNCYG